ncbi:MAG: hypothetical protein ABSG41_25495 [Bryobacteraceae bacterium]|jgi:hypothetical protein
MTLYTALVQLITRPVDLLVRRWNWKSAASSSLVRAMIFFFANLTAGWRAALGAMAAEYCYRALTSGFYGAMTQHLSLVEPEWQGAIAAMLLLPLSSHSMEFVVHWLRHTPHLGTSIVSSLCFTAISTLFNTYAMRRGLMVVGKNGASIAEDLRAMPRVIAGFLAFLPLLAWRSIRVIPNSGEV